MEQDPLNQGSWIYYEASIGPNRSTETYPGPKGIGVSFTDVWVACFGTTDKPDYDYNTPIDIQPAYTVGKRIFAKFSLDTLEYTLFVTPPDGNRWRHMGAAYSPLGDVWINSRVEASGMEAGAIFAFDPSTNTFNDMLGTPGLNRLQVAGDRFYTYSDNIGFGVNEIVGGTPTTTLEFQFQGCAPDNELVTKWESLNYDAELPGDSNVTVRARASVTSSFADQSVSPWSSAHSGSGPMDLSSITELQQKNYLQIEVEYFVSSSGDLPRIRNLSADILCSPIE